MPLRDLRDIRGPLILPINGKEYPVPPISADIGARLRLVAEGEIDPELSDMGGEDGYRLFLGPSYDEMVADKVDHDDIHVAWLVANAEFYSGRAAAERLWEAGASPEFRAALRAATNRTSPDSPPSPSTAKASSTRTRAATSPTTSRRATPPRAPRKTAARSNGKRSSGS